MFPQEIEALAGEVLERARTLGLRLGTAESCTGGLVCGALTAIAGSSDVVEGGVVSYSYAAKQALLGVQAELLAREGAVSEPVARAMAEGALRTLPVDLSVAVTGVAGPGGGSVDKPVGLVHFATARKGGSVVHRQERFGDLGRDGIRLASVKVALTMLAERLAHER